MEKYKKVKIEDEIVSSIVCDVCKKEYDIEKDVLEYQECQRINFEGGYDSVFGDGNTVEIDICQNCFRELLGKYVRIKERY